MAPTPDTQDPAPSAPPPAVAETPAADAAGQAMQEAAPAGAGGGEPGLVSRLGGLLKREPVLVVSLVYALVSFMGMWSNYWFYSRLGVPILDYLQGSDLFVIGIRRPDFVLVVLGAMALAWVGAMPQRWVDRNPERAEEMFRRWPGLRWVVAPPWYRYRRLGWLYRVENLLVGACLILSLQYLWVWNMWNARDVLRGQGKGQQVRLTLAGAAAPLPGQAQLLGTTSAYVFVWWPQTRQVEALPIANLARIESVAVLPMPGERRDAAPPTPAAGAAAARPDPAPEAAPAP